MSLSRRQALATLGGAGLLAAGCGRAGEWLTAETPLKPPTREDDRAVRLANRFGFGARPGELAAMRKGGEKAWLEGQLAAPLGDEGAVAERIGRLEIFHLGPWELRDWPKKRILQQMQYAALVRAVHSPWQLRERLAEFWSDHFNINADKGLGAYRKPLDDRTVVRENALGSFGNLLRASARSSAMLVYLDQQASNARHPNENYARELLELHTLGVDGGYTQRDVMEVARCFTGWTEERGFLRPKGAFKFDEALHDDGEKRVLGEVVPAGGGIADGDRVLEILVRHPATARNVSRKFARYFCGDAWPEVAPAVEKAFLRSDGDTKALVRAVYDSEPFWSAMPVLKRPFDYVASALRSLDASVEGTAALDHLAKMGQSPFLWPMPDGYPLDTGSWSGTLLARWNFAIELAHGKVAGCSVDLTRLARRTGHAPWTDLILGPDAAVDLSSHGLADAEAVALCLASPEFQWK
ncbi:MAG: DUF1800 domain-containing protein [Fimbriimonadaceae bacterium]|nr:DUF1800 domain-containing protein [Fimbriimonadaceae bacterium]QYK54847.1 MAG: DUF1800 domain-containing protein [Fimbriimonadaceae bacterium]